MTQRVSMPEDIVCDYLTEIRAHILAISSDDSNKKKLVKSIDTICKYYGCPLTHR